MTRRFAPQGIFEDMAGYLIQWLGPPLDEAGARSTLGSFDFEAPDDLKAVALATEFFDREIDRSDYAELLREPVTPRATPIRIWQQTLNF